MMKLFLLVTLLLSSLFAMASMPPVSGSFGVSDSIIDKYSLVYENSKSSKSYSINLLVTSNGNGQQFFVQCSDGQEMGFGVITIFKNTHKLNAVIDAGPECPAQKFSVELGYNESIIKFDDKWVILMRNHVSIPAIPFEQDN